MSKRDQEYTGGKVNYYEVEVKHPTREGRTPYTAECNDIIEALGLSFAEGEAFKAIWRKGAARIKPGKRGHDGGLYDAEKVSFYGVRMEIMERFGIGKPAMTSDFGQKNMLEPAAEIDDSSERMQTIGQNGNDGAAYLAGNIERHPETPRHHCGACGPWCFGRSLHQCTGGQMEGKP